jgi:NADPH-dependent curcumin reductase CurA
MASADNRQIVLATRPVGLPDATNLQLRHTAIPEPRPGQFQIKHLYIGLSPSARLRMSGDSDYGKGLVPGEVVIGQTVGTVTQSRNPDFREGEFVVTNGGWQEYSLSSGKTAVRLDPKKLPPMDALGLLGTSGLTAYVGLMQFASPGPGKTLVVSAASGSVGSVVGQIGKIRGCRVIGITGGADKGRYLTEELGFDGAVDHRSANFEAALRKACPDRIDIYFENVGGAVFKGVWPLMADFGRVVLCGMIAQYNESQDDGGPSWFPILSRRLTVSGFLLRDHLDRNEEFRTAATDWIAQGKLKMRYDVSNGIEQAPAAFIRMLEGKNFGKSIVKVGDV